MKKIAIIPARSGSKRIPNKNIKHFLGKPIIAYSIEAALKSGLYDEVMVSTNSESIKSIAKEYGANVPFLRSKKNSDDFASTVDVLVEVLQNYGNYGQEFHEASCIYACAPFVSPELLISSFAILKSGCDTVFPILGYSHPIQRALNLSDNGRVNSFFDVDNTLRTQDFKKAFHDAGMFYTFNVNRFFTTKSLRTSNTIGIEINDLYAQDIDSENDWKLAELKYKLYLNDKI